MNVSELRQKSFDELNEILLSLREDQFRLRLQQSTDQLSQTHLLNLNKKDIARVKTVQSAKAAEAT